MRISLWVGCFLMLGGAAWALSPDATREQILAELGKPTSVAKLGGKEILVYPNGVRVELAGGRIVSVKGLTLTDAAAPATTAGAAAGGPKVPELTEQEKKRLAKEAAEEELVYQRERGKGMAAMDSSIEALAAAQEMSRRPPPKKFSLEGFVFELGLKLFLTVAALKLACKYWGAEVFWSGIFIVAGADVLIRGAMGLVGALLLGFPTLFYADEAVAAVVMVMLLKKLSINHAIAQAVELTVTTKTFSIVVGSFLVTILLRLLH